MMQLQESVNEIGEVLNNLVGEFTSWRQSVETRLPVTQTPHQLANIASPEAGVVMPNRDQHMSKLPKLAQRRNQGRHISIKEESPNMLHSQMSPTFGQALTPIKQEYVFVPPQQLATGADSVRSEHDGATRLPPKEKSGLQSDHTTPAHKLLEEWPSKGEIQSQRRLHRETHRRRSRCLGIYVAGTRSRPASCLGRR